MPDSQAKRDWMKANSVNVVVKIMRRTEADLLEFLDQEAAKGQTKASVVKKALRYYRDHHEEKH